MRLFFRLLSYTILGLLVGLLMFIIIVPQFFSGRVAVVLSGSMGESLPIGSLAISMPVAPEMVKVGDIIAFIPPWDPEVTVSHRVIEILHDDKEQLGFRTKGDANEDPDQWIMPAESVAGKKVFHLPYLGYVTQSSLEYVRSWWGLVLLVAVPSVIIISGAVRDIRRRSNPRQKRLHLLLKRRRRWAKRTLRRMP